MTAAIWMVYIYNGFIASATIHTYRHSSTNTHTHTHRLNGEKKLECEGDITKETLFSKNIHRHTITHEDRDIKEVFSFISICSDIQLIQYYFSHIFRNSFNAMRHYFVLQNGMNCRTREKKKSIRMNKTLFIVFIK